MNYISEACLISLLWIVHATFSLYVYINLYAAALCRIVKKLLGIGGKLDGLHELRKYLTKIPSHIAFIVLESCVNYDALASLVIWSLALGIENISLYDVKGRLKRNQDILLLAINHKLKDVNPRASCTITWRPNTELGPLDRTVIVSKNGVMYPDINGNGRIEIKGEDNSAEGIKLNLSLLSRDDGKFDIVRCTKLLSERALRGEMTPADINEDLISRSLKTNQQLPDPSLVVRLGILHSNVDFLPWQLRLSEIHSINSSTAISIHQFTDVICKYSKCEQRFGK